MKPARRKKRREPTIALINIVFLMLVFFMVAGALAPPLDRELKLVKTGELDGVAPPDALVVHPDGTLSYRGDPVADAASYLAAQDGEGPVRLVPDRDLPAGSLVALARDLRLAGAKSVVIVTERALE